MTDGVLGRGKKSRDEIEVSEIGILTAQSKHEALQSVLQQVYSQKREAAQAGELC